MIVLGSVAKDDKGFLIETKFYTSGGKLILSQLTRARSAGDISSAAKEIAATVLERFPSRARWFRKKADATKSTSASRGTGSARALSSPLMAARPTKTGKVSGYRDIGKLKVRKTEDAASWTEVDALVRRKDQHRRPRGATDLPRRRRGGHEEFLRAPCQGRCASRREPPVRG